MNKELLIPKTLIKPDQLIGTKWISWSKSFADRMSVEFVDNKNCVYTSKPKKFPLTYDVIEGNVFISNIEGSFELRGSVLFNNNLPVFRKTA
ncbi:MAG: hypothetical protein FWC22_00835 [Treponema sp.]|nr:hypothetical protein [Treponema sp.]